MDYGHLLLIQFRPLGLKEEKEPGLCFPCAIFVCMRCVWLEISFIEFWTRPRGFLHAVSGLWFWLFCQILLIFFMFNGK